MELTPPSALTWSFGPAQQASAASTNLISADFETFLQMMTTQMQNQDPLNPMESTEFATQLATFSGVEQQVRTNTLLADLGAAFSTLGMGELGGWIGMEARAEMPVNFQGDPVTIAGARHSLADRMELIVRSEDGEIVQQLPIPLSDDPFEWTGTGPDGTTLPEGVYQITVQNWSGEDMLEERGAMIYAQIEEAQLVGGEVWLTMDGGMSIPADSVLGLRQA
jgi:flagellar basal-body rod modification protein FlgD